MKILYLVAKLLKKIQLPAIRDSYINKTSRVCNGAHLINVNIDRYSYIGNYCTLINTKIGRFSSIADNCIIGGAKHPVEWVSTSPIFYNGKNILNKNFSNHYFDPFEKTVIGNDVWIGNNCMIKGGVVIEDGAIIGMGSVVTKNVGMYEIWAGNPAKLIRKRFNEDIIMGLVDSRWWEKSDKEIKEYANRFNNPKLFISDYINKEKKNENSTY